MKLLWCEQVVHVASAEESVWTKLVRSEYKDVGRIFGCGVEEEAGLF